MTKHVLKSKATAQSAVRVGRILEGLKPDCDWNKSAWSKCNTIGIANDNGWRMNFRPAATAKILYGDEFLHLIFRVEDRFVRCVTTGTNGEVWKDACVEMFFAPLEASPTSYFNLEINCGGAIRLGFHGSDGSRGILASEEDIGRILVCHSMPAIVDEEIRDTVTWSLEIALPFRMLEAYSPIDTPRKGVSWRVNFQKCAENNSHPHWLSWAPINSPKPQFHLPEFFGKMEFD